MISFKETVLHILVACVLFSLFLGSVLPTKAAQTGGTCVRYNGRVKVYCSLCAFDQTGNTIEGVLPLHHARCKKWLSKNKTCKDPCANIPPVPPTNVNHEKHHCGLEGTQYRWYCSPCSIERNNATWTKRENCTENPMSLNPICIPEPGITTLPPSTHAPVSRTVFPPLDRLCIPGSAGTYSNCSCPEGKKPPIIPSALPDIVAQRCDQSRGIPREQERPN